MPNARKPVIYFVFRTNRGAKSTRFGGFAKRLQKTGRMPEAEYKTVALEDLVFAINAQSNAVILDRNGIEQFGDADFVYFKSWEGAPELAAMVVSYLRAKGIPFEDAAVGHAGMHKPSQTWKLWAAGVQVIPTIVASYLPDSAFLVNILGSGPYIVKPAKGEKGRGVVRVDSYDDIVTILKDQPSSWLVQPYIQNVGDYRVMTYGYEVRGALYRTAAEGVVVNNTSQGASSRYVAPSDVPQAIAVMAVKAASAVEHSVAGVDIITSLEGLTYALEVNQGSQIVTGHFTDKKMSAFADYINSRVVARYVRKKANSRLDVIGRYATVNFPELGVKGVFAKVDTGAYQSSIHATNIHEIDTPNGKVLEFTILEGHHKLMGNSVPARSRAVEYQKVAVKNSFGVRQDRFVIQTRISINGRMMKTGITLADRKDMVAPVLLGRRFLRGRYLVNVELDRHQRHALIQTPKTLKEKIR